MHMIIFKNNTARAAKSPTALTSSQQN